MMRRLVFWPRSLDGLVSLPLGVACLVALSWLAGHWGEGAEVWGPMLPGTLLEQLGERLSWYGGHDDVAFALYFGGTIGFYWALSFVALRLARARPVLDRGATDGDQQ